MIQIMESNFNLQKYLSYKSYHNTRVNLWALMRKSRNIYLNVNESIFKPPTPPHDTKFEHEHQNEAE